MKVRKTGMSDHDSRKTNSGCIHGMALVAATIMLLMTIPMWVAQWNRADPLSKNQQSVQPEDEPEGTEELRRALRHFERVIDDAHK